MPVGRTGDLLDMKVRLVEEMSRTGGRERVGADMLVGAIREGAHVNVPLVPKGVVMSSREAAERMKAIMNATTLDPRLSELARAKTVAANASEFVRLSDVVNGGFSGLRGPGDLRVALAAGTLSDEKIGRVNDHWATQIVPMVAAASVVSRMGTSWLGVPGWALWVGAIDSVSTPVEAGAVTAQRWSNLISAFSYLGKVTKRVW